MSYLAELVEGSGRHHGAELIAFYDRLETEHTNVLAELERYQVEEPQSALQMAALLWPFWMDRGHIAEGRARLATALERGPATASAIRASALYGAGTLAFRQAANAEAARLFEKPERSAVLRAAPCATDGRRMQAGWPRRAYGSSASSATTEGPPALSTWSRTPRT